MMYHQISAILSYMMMLSQMDLMNQTTETQYVKQYMTKLLKRKYMIEGTLDERLFLSTKKKKTMSVLEGIPRKKLFTNVPKGTVR